MPLAPLKPLQGQHDASPYRNDFQREDENSTRVVDDKLGQLVVFVLDSSGSMAFRKSQVETGFREGLKMLGERDFVALMSFADKTVWHQEGNAFSASLMPELNVPEGFPYQPQGLTALMQATSEALDKCASLSGNFKSRTVFLITDGDDTVCPPELLKRTMADLQKKYKSLKEEKSVHITLGAIHCVEAQRFAEQIGLGADNILEIGAEPEFVAAAFQGYMSDIAQGQFVPSMLTRQSSQGVPYFPPNQQALINPPLIANFDVPPVSPESELLESSESEI